jgi:hypothetical protein
MALRLTERAPSGTVHLRPAAIPLVIAALALPVIGALALGTLTSLGMGVGLAVGAGAVLALVVAAARARPDGPIAVAPRRDAERRVLVMAAAEITADAASRVAEAAGDPDDVRVVVPVGGRQIDRWTSATDDAREAAQDGLARSAGALVAAGLPVSGALGDGSLAQALEDELAGYPAERVVIVGQTGTPEISEQTEARLGLPLERIVVGPEPG